MPATITARQRDALYDQMLDRLSGIGDIELAARSEDFERADRLGREFADELVLICDDLGWGAGPENDRIELKTSPDVLQRMLGRLRQAGLSEREAQEATWSESRALDERNRLVVEACTEVLGELGTTT